MKIRQFALISIWLFFLVACNTSEPSFENEGDESEPYSSQEGQPTPTEEEIHVLLVRILGQKR